MQKRTKTKYPGVYYRESKRIGGNGNERIYYIVFKKDGKVIEEKVGRQYVDDMTPAKAARIRSERVEGKRLSRKEIRQAEEAKKQAEAGRWTIDRLWNAYKSSTAMKGVRTDENRYLNHLKPIFGPKEPHELVPFEVDKLRIKMLKTHAPQTVRHVLVLLNRIVNFGMKKKLSKGLPFTIDMPRVRNDKTEDLTPEQLKALIKAIEVDAHPMAGNIMKMALFTGMRRGELFRLKWSDIDFDRGFITIRDPKGGREQRIPINEAAGEVLRCCERTESEYVFPGHAGGRRTCIKKPVNRIKDRAGLPKDFRALHGLRHVYASMLASSGQVDMYTLQKLLTHKSPGMTQRYAHLRDEALRRASDLAGDIINDTINGKSASKIAGLKETNGKIV